MSHFYGTVKGTNGEATRCGDADSGMETHTASWQGAVRVKLFVDGNTGKDWAIVELVPWRGQGTNATIYSCAVRGMA